MTSQDDLTLREIHEKLDSIEGALRLGAAQAKDLQAAMRAHGRPDPRLVDGIRSRFDSQVKVREALLFYSRRQLVDLLGPPCEVGVVEHDVEQWKYKASDGAALIFLIHNDLVFNVWM